MQPTSEGIIDPSCHALGKVTVGKNTIIKPNTRIKGLMTIVRIVRLVQSSILGPIHQSVIMFRYTRERSREVQ